MKNYNMVITSALEKNFPENNPVYSPVDTYFTCLKGETFSFQLVCKSNQTHSEPVTIKVISPIKESISLKTVELVPTAYPCHGNQDDNYLFTNPRLVPDLLSDLQDDTLKLCAGMWQSIWVDVTIANDDNAGEFPIYFELYDSANELVCTAQTQITVYNAVLPEQELIHTEWFHGDCLADYYNVAVFSDRHWEILENFVSTAVKRGINMILTPIFTPPLDTAVGGYRTTIQLIDITLTNGVYSFNFDKLERWIDMCKRCGVVYYEMAHLFSQWGAKFAPKIMATVDGVEQIHFGWDTDGTGEAYKAFLGVYLPALTAKLHEYGIAKNSYFHISDEPNINDLDNYIAARDIVAPLLEGFTITDALSSYEFYKTGAVKNPVPANNHITPFLENNVPNLWTYYCTSQATQVSNRFMAMPSARNRIIGTQLYKYDIVGFLHWGYNFYNSMHSIKRINPYMVTDAGKAFPSGDSFLVYPKQDGTAEDSIRIMVLYHAIADLRAMKLLESLTSKEHVLALIEGELSSEITFFDYPKEASYLIRLRNNINKEIDRLTNA